MAKTTPSWPTVYPSDPSSPLGARIAALLHDPKVAAAHWGLAVTALDGTPLFGLEEAKLFRPASTAKLFTTTTALALLGPARQFDTGVVAAGELGADGVLHGSLRLIGGGDANFAGGYKLPYSAKNAEPGTAYGTGQPDPLADIASFADQILAKGVHTIEGDVIGIDGHFDSTPYPPGWAEEDLLWGYGAPVSALTVHDNQLDLTITPPAKSSDKATITLRPDLSFYRINPALSDSNVSLGVYGADFGRNQVLIERAPGSQDLHIVGDVATRYGPEHDTLAIDDPALYAALALRKALEDRGASVKGTVRVQHVDSGFVGSFLQNSREPLPGGSRLLDTLIDNGGHGGCNDEGLVGSEPRSTVLAEHLSPPLLQDLVLTLKTSQNLHAEIMLRNIAAEVDCEATLRRSLQYVRQFAIRAGLSGSDFQLYDGSGLSAGDLVTPRAEVQLLAYAATQPWFAQWKAALPVGGVDGTLSSRFTQPPMKGHIFAKTGTLGESRALAGYVQCSSGRELIFAILDDNHEPGSSADRAAMDKIVEAIAELN